MSTINFYGYHNKAITNQRHCIMICIVIELIKTYASYGKPERQECYQVLPHSTQAEQHWQKDRHSDSYGHEPAVVGGIGVLHPGAGGLAELVLSGLSILISLPLTRGDVLLLVSEGYGRGQCWDLCGTTW